MKRSLYIVISAAMALLTVSCQKEGGNAEGSATNTDTVSQAEVVQPDTVAKDDVTSAESNTISVQGEAVGGAMNSIFVQDEKGNTYDFAYPELDRDSIDGWEEGDIVKVKYMPSNDGNVVSSVRVVKHTTH